MANYPTSISYCQTRKAKKNGLLFELNMKLTQTQVGSLLKK